MTAFLTSVSDFFAALGGVVLNLVHGLVFVVTLVPKALVYITVCFGYIPAPILPFAVCIVAICICYLIIGR